MKVLLINGSPHETGCTFTALSEVAGALEAEGVETEIFWIGTEAVSGCRACLACLKLDNRCVFDGDPVNAILERIESSDGLVIGSPVHLASPSGLLISVLDRVFYAAGNSFGGKPGAAVVSARRAGTTAALDVLNRYFPISGMPIVPSIYWNMVHGFTPKDVAQDLEGLQTMRTLGRNMAWMLKCFELGKNSGIGYPKAETPRAWTHFIGKR
jgi:multimeric flavodoxin WrbA